MDTSEKYMVVGCDGFIGSSLSKYLFETKIQEDQEKFKKENYI